MTQWLLPMLECPCCGQVTAAAAPPGVHAGTIAYGPGASTAAVLLAAYGNVPAERAAHLIRMLLGMPVSPGFVGKAGARLDGRLQAAGFDDAMQAALAAEPALGADETLVNVLTPDKLMLRSGGCSGCALSGTCTVCRPLAKLYQQAKAPLE